MDEYDEALQHLQDTVSVFGVATVKVDDGQIFMFSRDFIRDLVMKLNDGDKDKVLIFVKKSVKPTRESLS